MNRTLVVLIATATIGLASPVLAQSSPPPQTDMAALTCGDLLKMSDGMALATISWYDGYFSNEHEMTATELSSMEGATVTLRGLCTSQPEQNLFEMMGKMAAQSVGHKP